MTVRVDGVVQFKGFATWEALELNGWKQSKMSWLPTSSIPSGTPSTDPIYGATEFFRGPANLAAASCGPGSTIESILLPRFGNASTGCNATSSYR